MQSFGTIGGLGLLTGATQSVECLASLTEKQQTDLFQELGVDNTEDASLALEELSETEALQLLVEEVGLSLDRAQAVLGCVGIYSVDT